MIEDASLTVRRGAVVGLVGPNGSGKSSLLRTVYRALRPTAGLVIAAGLDVHASSGRAVARKVAALPQQEVPVPGQTVAELVALGSVPHRGAFTAATSDVPRIAAALQAVGLSGFDGRAVDTLSGGELQRARFARALLQRPSVLVLDEPTNHLDVRHAHQLLQQVRELGRTAVVAIHDLSLAVRYADDLVLLDAGRITAAGPPRAVISGAEARQAFGVCIDVVEHPESGIPAVVTSLPG